jgi:hypothetical protein
MTGPLSPSLLWCVYVTSPRASCQGLLPRATSWNPKQETRNQICMEMTCAFRFLHVDDGWVFQDIARQEVNDLVEGSDDVRLSVVFFPQIGYLVAIPASDGPQENELSGLQVLLCLQCPVLCVSWYCYNRRLLYRVSRMCDYRMADDHHHCRFYFYANAYCYTSTVLLMHTQKDGLRHLCDSMLAHASTAAF